MSKKSEVEKIPATLSCCQNCKSTRLKNSKRLDALSFATRANLIGKPFLSVVSCLKSKTLFYSEYDTLILKY